ncbi:MAG TPA: SMC-Scp complex subunit ScpB [Candidatus Nanoarchaeia archaeon]|nr:SMC-Scp complex subunit ScpB [Candidatus Nanoarchaeia archaeon]
MEADKREPISGKAEDFHEQDSRNQEQIDEAKERESMRLIESILFVSGKFLDMKALISLSDMNPIIIKELLEKLRESYNERESALRIIEKNGMWKMDVGPEFSHLTTKLAGGSSEFTKAEQETLAIIAFKHPIKQSVIVKIRGNKAYDHIKKFSELGLVKKKRQGHTHELALSDEFYDYFGVPEPDKKDGGK